MNSRAILASEPSPNERLEDFSSVASPGVAQVQKYTLRSPPFARVHGACRSESRHAIISADDMTRGTSDDHWHRTEKDPGRPYEFKDAETLIDDFFDEVERVLRDRGIALQVTRTETSRRSK
jgi:hypothetical protein